MKNIKNAEIKNAIILENNEEKLVIVKDETIVELITDGSEFDKKYVGVVVFVSEDAIEVSDGDMIHWEYIEEINII